MILWFCMLIIACDYQDIAVSQECGGVKAQEQQQMNTAPAVRLDYKQGAKSDGFGQLVQLC